MAKFKTILTIIYPLEYGSSSLHERWDLVEAKNEREAKIIAIKNYLEDFPEDKDYIKAVEAHEISYGFESDIAEQVIEGLES